MQTIVVGSGKGGTGKTTVSSLIATHLTKYYNVGLLDADLSCPNIDSMFGIEGHRYKFTKSGKLEPVRFEGIGDERFLEVFSIGADIPQKQYVAWSGKQLTQMLKEQFLAVDWQDIDILVIDLPPSTSDSVQTVLEMCGNATVMPVTMNTPLAVYDTRKFLQLVQSKNMIVSGMFLNLSDIYQIYSLKDIVKEVGIDVLAEIPFNKIYCGQQGGIEMLMNHDGDLADAIRRAL